MARSIVPTLGTGVSLRLIARRMMGLASLACALAQAQTTVPGKIPGEFSVSPSGAATYRIPIQVPPGIAGMEPKLALVYNSQAGNGIMGMGWSLEGLSAITRCPKTMATDGVRAAITHTPEDRFCMDGQRLINVAGAYGAAGSEYRTEIDSFSKVIANGAAAGNAANGPQSFTVKTKAGLTLEYGSTADSRIEAQGKVDSQGNGLVRVWALSKMRDAKGNSITYAYTEDNANGEFKLVSIVYSGSRTINFEYEGRPDVLVGFEGNGTVKVTTRLAKIKAGLTSVSSSNSPSVSINMTSHSFKYESSSATKRSQIRSLGVCHGTGNCLSEMNVTWGNLNNQINFGAESGVGGWRSDTNYYPADVNGDGKTDIIEIWNFGNGEGRATTWLSVGNGFSWGSEGYIGHWDRRKYFPADLNGDGLTDLIEVWPDGAGAKATSWLSNGNGFVGSAVSNIGGWRSDTNYYPADVNGDGKTDIIEIWNFGNGEGRATTWLSVGNGFSWGSEGYIGHWDRRKYFPADLNGDGLTDLIEVWPDGAGAKATSWLSNGNGFVGSAVSNIGGWRADTHYLPVDLTGDGRPDLIELWNSGGGGARATSWVTAVETSSDLLTSVSSGLNRIAGPIKYTTLPLSLGGSYLKDFTSAYPRVDLQIPMQVVSSVSQSNGAGGVNTTNYSYAGLKAEHASEAHPGSGRGMLGFRWMKSREESTGVETYTEFSQQWPHTGQVLKSETRLVKDGVNQLLKRSVNSPACYQSEAPAGAAKPAATAACTPWVKERVYFPFVASSNEESWDLNGVQMPTLFSQSLYGGYADQSGTARQFGDPTQITVDIREGTVLKHRKVTTNLYRPAKTDGANWESGRLNRASVTSSQY